MTSKPFSEKTRLYVQLRPDIHALRHLQTIRDKIHDGRPVSDDQLHMTVIHIGELSRLIAALPDIDSGNILRAAEVFARSVEKTATHYQQVSFTLNPTGVESFGQTIAITYNASDGLTALHAKALQMLIDMLKGLGVDDPRAFMENDPNLRFALTLRPHVALAKSASPPKDLTFDHEASFSLMKIVY
jgi:2'-5' RNA ligase